MKTALIVEDVAEAQSWMQKRLKAIFSGVVVQVASSLGQAFELCERQRFDLALIDLSLPDGSGVRLIEALSQQHPHTVTLVVTIYDDDEHIFPALEAGAKGYLLKDMPASVFEAQLGAVQQGEPALSPSVSGRMVAFFNARTARESLSASSSLSCSTLVPGVNETSLTPREQDVLCLIAKGYTLNEVAVLLGLSPHTVNGYIKTLYRKLEISSRAEATLEATRLGLVKP